MRHTLPYSIGKERYRNISSFDRPLITYIFQYRFIGTTTFAMGNSPQAELSLKQH